MSILVNKNSKVLVQGITGSAGSFHAKQCIAYGTQIVAGCTPNRGGETFAAEGPGGKAVSVPVFDTTAEAVKQTGADTSCIFVPALGAADAILEAVDAGCKLVICITEGIPVTDMIRVRRSIEGKGVRLVGPNCPGVITPGECKIGIMPGHIHRPGKIS
jgi:succinyl-CoA synthetase alpha subunit